MPEFEVSVEKKLIVTGKIKVTAESSPQAFKAVVKMMENQESPLQTSDPRIEWGDPEYDDYSFIVTGDVDSADDEVSEPEDDDESNRMNPDHHDDAVS